MLTFIALFSLSLLAFLVLFLPLYPLIEPLARLRGMATYFYYYPNANGAGLLLERIADRVQILRVDWHRFNLNVGAPGRPYDLGGISRHKPSIQVNLPHIDRPNLSLRHWPWRQFTAVLLPHVLAKGKEKDHRHRHNR